MQFNERKMLATYQLDTRLLIMKRMGRVKVFRTGANQKDVHCKKKEKKNESYCTYLNGFYKITKET